jgi:putative ABC transport system substrate-binding protein
MKRREFIPLLGGAVAWPLPASALPTPKLPTIGFLSPTTASVENHRVTAFVHRLRELGWIEGRTAGIKLRWAEGRTERAAEFVVEFDRQKVDFIVSRTTVSVLAAKQAASVVMPVVFAEGDPVGTGFVVCLASPGGNVTGLPFPQTNLAVKQRELLRDVVPTLRRLAILANAGKPVTLRDMREVEAAVRTFGLTVVTVEIRRIANIPPGLNVE